jgi:GntR family phosphonate transport system transcriptional regulator
MTPEILPVAGAEPGTAWRRIAETLATAIANGDYSPGDTLPASVVLAERYGVHRHTVRQAFRHLADQGLVTVVRGRGTQVTTPRFPYRIGRRVSMRTNFGAAGIAVTSSMLAAEIVDGEAATCERLALRDATPLWRIETLSLAGGVPVSTGVHWLEAARFPGFDRVLLESSVSISAALSVFGVADYVRRSTRLSARLATAREVVLLRIAEGNAVMLSSAVDALPDMTPIHFIEAAFAAERMEMVVEPFTESL